MRATKNATRMRGQRVRQHAVKQPSSMPRFDGVKYEFGTIQFAYNASHTAIIA